MKCVICKHGDVVAGTTTITFDKERNTVVFKQVPAKICANCGEEYLDEATTNQLLTIADEAFRTGVYVDVRDFHSAELKA